MIEQSNNWPDTFYGDHNDFYSTVYKTMGMFERFDTGKQVEDILILLKPKEGSHILDWCGGWGRHAIPLAKKGFKVTLLDFSKKYLDEAKIEAGKQGVELEYVHSDFRNTPSDIQADYAVNLFTAGLGYYTEEDDVTALKSLFGALKPNARVLIDTVSMFWVATNFKDNNWTETADGKKRYLQNRTIDFWTNTEHEVDIFQDAEAGTEEKRNVDLKLYTPADLSRALKVAGFIPQELYGGIDGSEFSFNSKRLVVIAERP